MIQPRLKLASVLHRHQCLVLNSAYSAEQLVSRLIQREKLLQRLIVTEKTHPQFLASHGMKLIMTACSYHFGMQVKRAKIVFSQSVRLSLRFEINCTLC